MQLETWIPSMIAVGALSAIWLWLRRAVDDLRDQIKQMNKEISKMEDNYLPEVEHTLICRSNALEIEKTFRACFDEYKDSVFKKLRELEEKIIDFHTSSK